MGAMDDKAQYKDGWWESADGLKLHFRDYPGPKSKPVVLCIPGLTRNARDFAHVAERLAGDWRVICVELRGRGESTHAKTPESYTPLTYLADLEALIAQEKIKKLICIGTSLGGVLSMMLATKPGRVVGALINDIGPEIDQAGLNRIKANVGRPQNWPTWIHAARWFSDTQSVVFPTYGLEQWIAFAKRTCKLTPQGRIVLDYDMKLSEPLRAETQQPDLWPVWQALGDVPIALLRGGLSDLLSTATAKAMVKSLPNVQLTTVKNVGHAPMLDEPEAVRALNALMQAVSV